MRVTVATYLYCSTVATCTFLLHCLLFTGCDSVTTQDFNSSPLSYTFEHLSGHLNRCDKSQITQFTAMISQILALLSVAFTAAVAIAPDSYHYDSRKPVQGTSADTTNALVSTVFGTATLTLPVTISTMITPSATEAQPEPVYTATQLYAYREDSPIHLLPLQARGLYFQLGGLPTTVCPSFVEDCPPGVLTGINQCELVSGVPSEILSKC